MTTPLLGSLAALALALPLSLPAAPTTPPAGPPAGEIIFVDGDQITIRLESDGLMLVDLLTATEALTGRPVTYVAEELSDRRVVGVGDIITSRSALRSVIDELLLEHGLLTYDTEGPSPRMRVVSLNVHGRSRPYVRQVIVASERLEESPPANGGLYSTSFSLHHIDARSTMATFNPMFDSTFESIRNVESCNALIVSSMSMTKLRAVAELIAQVDVPSGEARALEQRVKALEAQLETLHKK